MAITVDPEPVWDEPNEVPKDWIETVDDNVAATHRLGTFAQTDDAHFFLCEFTRMTDELPDIEKSMKMLAELHTHSHSPNGKYGFHVPTLQGTIPQYTEWTESWEDFFTKSIRLVFENEERSQGSDPEV
ncbi:MAG: hypothetical protein Q9169_006120 [Polycauliona sp. 2 TL-2023]